jgi:hypothetical protein
METHRGSELLCRNCGGSYFTVRGFDKHIQKCSQIGSQVGQSPPFTASNILPVAFDMTNILQRHAAKLALRLESEHSIPNSTINSVFNEFHSLINHVAENGNTQMELVSSLASLNSSYKRKKYYAENFRYQQPHSVLLQLSNKTTNGYFYPLQELLETLLSAPDFTEYVFRFVNNPHHGIQRDILHGDIICSSILKGPTIFLQIYMDEVELCNPIGTHRNKHKLCMFYLQAVNIPPQFRSTRATVFPLAVLNSSCLKYSSYENLSTVLSDFVSTSNIMSDSGLELTTSHGKIRCFLKVISFLGDSLAANHIGGFKEGFSRVLRCCRSCNLSQIQMETAHEEVPHMLRGLTEHFIRVSEMNLPKLRKHRVGWSTLYGINGPSVLSKLKDFDLTKQMPHDPMHILLEGICPHHLMLCLNSHISAGFYSMTDINDFLSNCDYHKIDKNDKPVALRVEGTNLTSSQMLVILRYIPFFLYKYVPPNNPQLKALILLIRICQITFSPILDQRSCEQLSRLIKYHNDAFHELYPGKFIPKLHFLTHFPSQARRYGPLRFHSCMAFERKHQTSKNVRWYNFKNLSFSVATHLHKNFSSMFFDERGIKKMNVFGSDGPDIRVLDSSPQGTIAPKCIQITGVSFIKGDVIMDEQRNFWQLQAIIQAPDNSIPLVRLDRLEYIGFQQSMNAFILKSTCISQTMSSTNLVSLWPLIFIVENDLMYAVCRHISSFPDEAFTP